MYPTSYLYKVQIICKSGSWNNNITTFFCLSIITTKLIKRNDYISFDIKREKKRKRDGDVNDHGVGDDSVGDDSVGAYRSL